MEGIDIWLVIVGSITIGKILLCKYSISVIERLFYKNGDGLLQDKLSSL